MGISHTQQGQVLFGYIKFIRTLAEPSLQWATGVKSFVISNDREKSESFLLCGSPKKMNTAVGPSLSAEALAEEGPDGLYISLEMILNES